jgi:hypothetical protein
MGLFDPAMFDPQPGQGSYTGLLDRLRALQGPVPMPMGRPASAPGAPGDPAADPTTALASASPTSGRPFGWPPTFPWSPDARTAPAATGAAAGAQPPGPGFLDRTGGNLSGLYNASPMLMQMGGAMMSGGLGAGLQAGAKGAEQLQDRNIKMMGMRATFAALKQKGYSDADAMAILMNPEAGKAAFGNVYGPDTASVVDIKNPDTGIPSSGILKSKSGELTPAVPLPAAAIMALRANPRLAPDFDAKYGPGMSARALGSMGQQ